MKELMRYSTKLSNAKSKGSSLRSTVPSAVIQTLKLETGDKIEWIIALDKEDPESVTVTIKPSTKNEEKEDG